MRYKESAIAVMIAVMLGAASLLGGLSTIPAFAIHDPNATQIAGETFSQPSDVTKTINAVQLIAEKYTLRSSGTITIELIQGNQILSEGTLEASSLNTSPTAVQVAINSVNVQGNFEIRVFYLGSGTVSVSNIDVVNGINGGSNGDGNGGNGQTSTASVMDEDATEVASMTKSQGANEKMAVESVEFAAEKFTLRTEGTLTVALMQNGQVIDADQINAATLDTFPRDMAVSFNNVELTDDFRVVFMYMGSGTIRVSGINVVGDTTTAETPTETPELTPFNPDGTVNLVVKAVDQNDEPIVQLWVGVNQGIELIDEFTPATFVLQPGIYTLIMDDFNGDTDSDAGTSGVYTFMQWSDGETDKTRNVNLTNGGMTLTAEYNTDGTAPASSPTPTDTDSDGIADEQDACDAEPETVNGFQDADGCPDMVPSTGGPGSLTVFAHRIPSEHWGGASTFTGANAAMWYVLYNSTGWIVNNGFFDEDGTTITGLNEGETYWISPTDCDECHGSTHDVVFDHWEDGSTERQRPVTTGSSSHAHYMYDPDP